MINQERKHVKKTFQEIYHIRALLFNVIARASSGDILENTETVTQIVLLSLAGIH